MDRGFVLKEYGRTTVCEIPSFNRTGLVTHCFTTRLGGRGTEPYKSMNLAFHVGDDVQTVVSNREIICRILNANTENLVSAKQTHGVNIEIVNTTHAGKGAYSYNDALPNTDGLVTDRPGLVLATFYADCVPIFILDPVNKVIASVHAGWKGTAGRIGALAVKKMTDHFGTKPADCIAGIGPSIGPCCYEVGEKVKSIISGNFEWSKDVLKWQDNISIHLDLWDTNRRILQEAGISENNVELAQICTCCNKNIFFSHRGENGTTGRMGAFIMLKE